ELLLRLADALREQGEFAAARARIEEALALAESIGASALTAQAEILALRLQMHVETELDLERLLGRADAAIAQLEQHDEQAGLAQAWFVRAWITWIQCRAEATRQALERSLEYAKRADDQRTL